MNVQVVNPHPPCSRYIASLQLALALALSLICALTLDRPVDAKAPPLATITISTEALAAPVFGAPVVTLLPAGAEVTLTGSAAPGYLEIEYDGEAVWVPIQHTMLGVRPGIDTAVTLTDLPLLDAPMREATVLAVVPEGQTVILTGASVDGYDAGSHNGVGGWLAERGLLR